MSAPAVSHPAGTAVDQSDGWLWPPLGPGLLFATVRLGVAPVGTTATPARHPVPPSACSSPPATAWPWQPAGALALWLAQSRRAWVVVSLATVSFGIAGIGGRAIPLTASLPQAVAPESGGLYVGSAEVGSAEFLPKTTHLTTWHEDEARGRWLYERMFPEAAWLGGRVTVWHGTLAIRQLSGGSLWTSADVTVAGNAPAVLAFHQFAFAGWRAWVDDRPVPATPAPWIETQAIQPGFLLVEVPPGDHRVAIRFGPSGPSSGRRHYLLARLPGSRRLGAHRCPPEHQAPPPARSPRRRSRHCARRARGQRAARAPAVATATGAAPAAHHRDQRG